jgi:DNA-binding NtrC family response regulator
MIRKLEVLILDDELIVCKRLKPAIEKMGCNVETFLEPKSALDRIGQKEFDIVITDVRMEEIDGIQVLEHVREKSKRTMVIVITGYAMISLAREAMEKGAFDFVSKPFKPDEIRRVILNAAVELGMPLDYQIGEKTTDKG